MPLLPPTKSSLRFARLLALLTVHGCNSSPTKPPPLPAVRVEAPAAPEVPAVASQRPSPSGAPHERARPPLEPPSKIEDGEGGLGLASGLMGGTGHGPIGKGAGAGKRGP